MREPDLAGDIAICQAIHSWKASAEVTAEVTDLVAALGADTATHDRTIDAPSDARLALGAANGIVAPAAGWKTRFGNDMILLINQGRAGGLSKSQIISAIDDTFGIAHAPAVVNTPYVSSNGVIVGSVCSCTQGQWTGSRPAIPTSGSATARPISAPLRLTRSSPPTSADMRSPVW